MKTIVDSEVWLFLRGIQMVNFQVIQSISVVDYLSSKAQTISYYF